MSRETIPSTTKYICDVCDNEITRIGYDQDDYFSLRFSHPMRGGVDMDMHPECAKPFLEAFGAIGRSAVAETLTRKP